MEKLHQRLITQKNDTDKTLVFHLRPGAVGYCSLEEPQYNRRKMSYRLVALVDTTSLDRAFLLTNHTEDFWYNNPEVQVVASQVRSSMNGDVFVLPDNSAYLCCRFGWSTVNV